MVTIRVNPDLCHHRLLISSPFCTITSAAFYPIGRIGTLLHKYEYPSFVGLVETFLDDSIQVPILTNYETLARKDRGGLRQKGGVILFVRKDLAKYAVQLGNSESAERVGYYCTITWDLF